MEGGGTAPGTQAARAHRLGLVLVFGGIAALHLPEDRALETGFLLGALGVASAGWLLVLRGLARGALRPSFATAFLLAASLRAVALLLAPACSDDLYRYVWEGLVQHAGRNPYLLAPADPGLADLALAHPEIWEGINHKDVPAAYPPVAQLAFLGVSSVSASLKAMQVFFGALDLAVFALLWKALPAFGVPSAMALVHGLSPLGVVELSAEGHSDALGILALVLALWLGRTGRPRAAGAALGLGVAARYLPLLVLPFLLRKDRRVLLPFLAAALLPWAPFLEPTAELLRGLGAFGERWRASPILFGVLEWAAAPFSAGNLAPRLLAALALAAVGLGLWWRRTSPPGAAATLLLAVLLLSPVVHPWYATWLVPFLCFFRLHGAAAFTLLAPLSYAVLPGWILEQRWEEPHWARWAFLVPVLSLVALDLVRLAVRGPAALSRAVTPPGTSGGGGGGPAPSRSGAPRAP